MAGKRQGKTNLKPEVAEELRKTISSLLQEIESILHAAEDGFNLVNSTKTEIDWTQNIAGWMTTCGKYIANLREILNGPNSSAGSQKCINLIQQFICLNTKFEFYLKQGFGMGENSKKSESPAVEMDNITDRVRWSNCKSAFKCRLQTSFIINLVHIDVKST
ncbi:uncharacterized protein LOC122501108 [Leptopilina heterotoma]|uniref:uncharacterized protein LOC122501108 n=1 Tax=Leptopilina heterotoma TaxID=63436 RepID=UPI001CA9F698|nr:uncharacterized protein LOC122501108 [Leptopilina heterotoma]